MEVSRYTLFKVFSNDIYRNTFFQQFAAFLAIFIGQ